MFAAMAAEAGCQLHEIEAMAAALPGRGEQLGHGAPARHAWVDVGGAFAAAFRPVNILPEDHFGHAPFVDHELIFVCRARLDDRAGLLQQLRIEAARGATLSDSEILRDCYRKWREATPQHVYGDFAFVAWERWSRRTVAATDHLGNFRLFHCRAAGRVLFATQLGALLACPEVRAVFDVKTLGLMVVGSPGPGCTPFQGIRALSGGELLIHHDGMIRVERWWRPDTTQREVHPHSRDYVDEARALFDSAVASRVRSRGGAIATLSGGLDSTLVAVTAARQVAVSGKVLEALTAVAQPGLPVGAPSADDDGVPWAAAVADFHPNIRQRLVSPGGMTPLDILPTAHAVTNMPVLNPANLVWKWQMSARAAHSRAHVILCGEHGNQSIGYAGDLSDANFSSLRKIAGAAQRTWDRVRCIGSNPRKPGSAPRVEFHGVVAARILLPGSELLPPKFRGDHYELLLEPEPPATEREMFASGMTAPQRTARMDFAAQFAVEWLDPTADRKLLERLLTFPLHVFRVGNRPRGLARELGRGLLPESVRLRRAHSARFPDQTGWFAMRAPHYRDTLQTLRNSSSCDSFLDLPAIEAKLEALCAGHGTAADAAIVHRALDAGLFAASFESTPDIAPGPTAIPAHEPSFSQHRPTPL